MASSEPVTEIDGVTVQVKILRTNLIKELRSRIKKYKEIIETKQDELKHNGSSAEDTENSIASELTHNGASCIKNAKRAMAEAEELLGALISQTGSNKYKELVCPSCHKPISWERIFIAQRLRCTACAEREDSRRH